MKIEEIRELSTTDLQDRLAEIQKEYTQMKVNHSVTPLDDPSKITKQRRLIARIKTELRQRELNNK